MKIQTPTSLDEINVGGTSGKKEYKPIPEDSYNVRIIDLKPGKSQANNTKLDLTLEVTDGDFAHRRVFDTVTITGKALWRLKQVLVAFGITFDSDGFESSDLMGAEAVAVVGQEEGTDGKVRNKVVKYLSA